MRSHLAANQVQEVGCQTKVSSGFEAGGSHIQRPSGSASKTMEQAGSNHQFKKQNMHGHESNRPTQQNGDNRHPGNRYNAQQRCRSLLFAGGHKSVAPCERNERWRRNHHPAALARRLHGPHRSHVRPSQCRYAPLFRAGRRSLRPSPLMATTSPLAFSALTSPVFFGTMLAKTLIVRNTQFQFRFIQFFNSGPVMISLTV